MVDVLILIARADQEHGAAGESEARAEIVDLSDPPEADHVTVERDGDEDVLGVEHGLVGLWTRLTVSGRLRSPEMTLAAGTYSFGPRNAALRVRTFTAGAAARAGHDLLLEVTRWRATLELSPRPGATRASLAAGAESLRVVNAGGGLEPLAARGRETIERRIAEEVLGDRPIRFTSRSARRGEGGELLVEGELELAGVVGALSFGLGLDGAGTLRAQATIAQTDWGITPYSALLGALKVRDEVEVTLEVAPRRGEPEPRRARP